jgi:hypothetical protein
MERFNTKISVNKSKIVTCDEKRLVRVKSVLDKRIERTREFKYIEHVIRADGEKCGK